MDWDHLCVNPAHLFVGTQQDNINDAMRKGRLRKGENWATPARIEGICKGEKHGMRKLTEAEVREILLANQIKRLNCTHTAKKYCVSRRTISDIINRRNWTHVEI